MKKIFLILVFTALMSIGVNAEENQAVEEATAGESKIKVQGNVGKSVVKVQPAAPQSSLSDSFMAAFGMAGDAGGAAGDGDAGGAASPGMGGSSSSAGTMSIGLSVISTQSANQVTPPFTPYSYQN